MTGTFINVVAVLIGSLLGYIFHARLSEKYKVLTFQAIGLFNIFLGVKMAIASELIIVPLFALILGGVIGELISLDAFAQSSIAKSGKLVGNRSDSFAKGMLTAFLIFCIGPMTILGAIEDGLGNSPTLLMTKSVMDGITSMFLAASFGLGVLFSIVPLFLFQGGISLFASELNQLLSDSAIAELEATGGIMLIGLGISILEIKEIKVFNFLPALIFAPLMAYLFPWILEIIS